MKILITGANGMLGRTLRQELADETLVATDIETDITQAPVIDDAIARHKPDAVIHCAAFTAVDRCETERAVAFAINAVGSCNVALSCARHRARLIAISTDYVFDGNSPHPYTEQDTATGGKTVYGQSKFAGEELIRGHCPDHIIARTAWLYGPGGPSFVHTMLNLASKSSDAIKVVNDQRGNPTSTLALARHIRILLRHPDIRGTVHLTCEDSATWYEFAREIFRLKRIAQDVIPVTTAEYPRPAPRPANSQLEKAALKAHRLPPMPDWRDALAEFLAKI